MASERSDWLAIAIVIAVASACSLSVPFAEQLLFTTQRPQLPRAEDCERCHGDVYREWLDSPHANAWSSVRFAALTAGYAAEACLDCHAPAPLGAAGEVAIREDHRAEGVTCVSCHLSTTPADGKLAMRGPHARTSPIDVHPVIKDPLFLEPELCGTCHARILDEWKASPEPLDGSHRDACQACHMPEVRRKIETYDPDHPYSALIVALGKEVDGRQHRFAVPDQSWEDIDVEAHPRPGGGLTVVVRNRLPHAIPTGTFGRREARVRVTWEGGEAVKEMRADLDEGIPAGETRTFEFPEVLVRAEWDAVLERREPLSGAYERVAPEPDPHRRVQ